MLATKTMPVSKIIDGSVVKIEAKVSFESEKVILREAVNEYKYSICLNTEFKPVLMSLNNKKIALTICKQLPNELTAYISSNKGACRRLLNKINMRYLLGYDKNWTNHI